MKSVFLARLFTVYLAKPTNYHIDALLWVHSPNTEHVRVCVHVECSCILGVVDDSILYDSMDA